MLLARTGRRTITGFVQLFRLSCVVRHLIACKGKGALVICEWPASCFWPLVNPLNGDVNRIEKDYFSLPVITPLFI